MPAWKDVTPRGRRPKGEESMSIPKRSFFFMVLLSSLVLGRSSLLRADGGTVRLSERRGAYQITVFTAPLPLRAGPVDVSVLVQDAITGETIPQAKVVVRATPRDRPQDAVSYPATTEPATNKLLHAAVFELSRPGWWELDVTVQAGHGPAVAHLAVEAAEPLPPWRSLWPWVAWPAVAVLLFGVHQVLVWRKSH
jgi:hypothetical protein